MLRLCLVLSAMVAASAASAGDRIYLDKENGFSLTFPEEWQVETPSGSSIRLKTHSTDRQLVCRVQVSKLAAYEPRPGETPKTMIEQEWGPDDWKAIYGDVFTSLVLSHEGLLHLADGYPARGVDIDYQLGDPAIAYSHARVVLTADTIRLATTSCDVTADSPEKARAQWTAEADQAAHVLATFLLVPPQ